MDAATEKKITEALNAAEAAGVAAQRAIDARDIDAAPRLVTEALVHTLAVLSIGAGAGKLEVLQNLAPAVVYFTELLTKLAGSPFDGIERIKIGNSIGA